MGEKFILNVFTLGWVMIHYIFKLSLLGEGESAPRGQKNEREQKERARLADSTYEKPQDLGVAT